MSKWKSYAGFDAVPAIPGVYVVFGSQGCPVYVGQSKNVKARLKDHKRSVKWIYNHRLYIRVYEVDDATVRRNREARLIAKLKPGFNVYGKLKCHL